MGVKRRFNLLLLLLGTSYKKDLKRIWQVPSGTFKRNAEYLGGSNKVAAVFCLNDFFAVVSSVDKYLL